MTTPGILPTAPALQPFRRASPSRYTSLRECALREAWSLCWRPPLLPKSPAARLGTTIHGLLESASKGELEDGRASILQLRWDALLQSTEYAMSQSWLEKSLLPLRLSVPDFEVRRLRGLASAAAIAEDVRDSRRRLSADRTTGNEVWVASGNGLVGGYIDCVVETATDLIIRDFKTGAILDADEPDSVKACYQDQLKLYAALYQSSFGRWPTRLELIPLRGAAIRLSFTPAECLALLNAASTFLEQLNEKIEQLKLATDPMVQPAYALAAPAPDTCRFCEYRPACLPYHERRGMATTENWPRDVIGELVELRPLGNGKLSLSVSDPSLGPPVNVRGIDPDHDRHPALPFLQSQQDVALYNLRASSNPHTFGETVSTVVYASPAVTAHPL